MHSIDTGGTSVPGFLTKIWKLVDDPTTDDLICWSENGTSFIIRNPAVFSRELLPLYFKHNNMASFIRQLNMYGFRKITHIDQGSLRSESEEMEFFHLFFLKGNESLLALIKRKVSVGRVEDGRVKPEMLKEVMSNVKALCEKQETIDQLLVNTKKENEALWREVAILRQKHMKQQQIIEKLIQFLVSIVQPNRNLGLKRKLPFMIHDAVSGSDGKIPRLARQFSFDRRSTADFVMSPSSTSSKTDHGPVIHDITDSLEESELATGSESKQLLSETARAKALLLGCPESPTVDSPGSPVTYGNSPLGSPLVPEKIEPLCILDTLEPFPPALSPGADALDANELQEPPLDLMPPVIEPSAGPSASVSATHPPAVLFSASQDDAPLETPKPVEVSLTTPVNSPASIDSLISIFPSPSGNERKSGSVKRMKGAERQLPQDAGDMQVAISEPTTSALTRNNFADHGESIETDLDWLQQQLSGSSLNIDASALLGLFSCDEPLSSNSIVMENMDSRGLASDTAGKELVQYPSGLFDWDADEDSSSLFDVPVLDGCGGEPVVLSAAPDKEKNPRTLGIVGSATDASCSPFVAEGATQNLSVPDTAVLPRALQKKRPPARKK